MGILLLAYYYPPLKSMGSMRAYYLSHEFLHHFDQVAVLSTTNAMRLEQEQLPISKDISVQYIPTLDYRTLTSVRSQRSHYREETKSRFLGQVAVKALNSFPISSIIGEGGYRYRKAAFRAACDLIDQGTITHLWSSFRPYADHEIASKLKAKYPHLIWIADYRDIHVDVLKDNVYWKGYQKSKATKLMASADLVTTISEGCLDHLKHIGQRQIVLYNGLPALTDESARPELSYDKLQITFTGSLYGESRDPSLLLRAIAQLISTGKLDPAKVNINYAGKDAEKWRRWMENYQLLSISTIHGMLPYDKSLELQQKSHINLLLTFSHPDVLGAVTGKMLEYLQSRKLTLCIIKGVRDLEIERFISKYSHGSTFYNNADSLQPMCDFVAKAYEHMLAADASFFTHDKPIEELSWSHLTRQLLQEISAI